LFDSYCNDGGGCTTFLPTTITTPSPVFVFDVVVVLVLLVCVVVVRRLRIVLLLLLILLLLVLLFDTIRIGTTKRRRHTSLVPMRIDLV